MAKKARRKPSPGQKIIEGLTEALGRVRRNGGWVVERPTADEAGRIAASAAPKPPDQFRMIQARALLLDVNKARSTKAKELVIAERLERIIRDATEAGHFSGIEQGKQQREQDVVDGFMTMMRSGTLSKHPMVVMAAHEARALFNAIEARAPRG